VQKLNQGTRKKRAVYRFFLDFLVLFYQEKSTKKLSHQSFNAEVTVVQKFNQGV